MLVERETTSQVLVVRAGGCRASRSAETRGVSLEEFEESYRAEHGE